MKLRPEILLHPNIPKPMHGLAPRTIKGDAWWDEQQQIAYAKTNYCCSACGVHKSEAKYHKWLEAHELYDMDYKNGKMIFVEIVALCHSCHNYIHSGRMQVLVRKGEMTNQKMIDITNHGDLIIKNSKLKRKEYPEGIAKWSDWRLVMDGKEYKGQFDSYEAWQRHYAR